MTNGGMARRAVGPGLVMFQPRGQSMTQETMTLNSYLGFVLFVKKKNSYGSLPCFSLQHFDVY